MEQRLGLYLDGGRTKPNKLARISRHSALCAAAWRTIDSTSIQSTILDNQDLYISQAVMCRLSGLGNDESEEKKLRCVLSECPRSL
jgi:hypothetical protein